MAMGDLLTTSDRMARSLSPVIRVRDVANVAFGRPDLDKASAFLTDFGLAEVHRDAEVAHFEARGGYGPCYTVHRQTRPAFIGLALEVAERADLDALANLPGASAVEPAEGWAEGLQVRLTDPAGNAVRAVFGPRREPIAPRKSLAYNLEGPRSRINDMHRPAVQPATVLRLGHVVISVIEFFKCVRWYMDTFGLVPSDIQTIGEGDPALVFLRCDRGDEPADHHSLVLAQNVVNKFSHCAFECVDIDDIAMGQEYLQSKGWKHAWGMGRHLLGSQIFDYWRDPWGDKVEHFVDSDMFTADRQADISPLTLGGLYQWGPPVPSDFESPILTPAFLWTAIANVRRSEEMTFARMGQLLKAIGGKPRPWVKGH
jgi:catechol 2,3-dioxygenase-like lactoylglutathione lyase family enzyme